MRKIWPQKLNLTIFLRKFGSFRVGWSKSRVQIMDIWGSYPQRWRVIWQQIFHILFIRVQSDFLGTSGQVRAIPQHENSSRNSILITRMFENWRKLRNYRKHDLSDKTASPASWGTFKFKISLLTQQILWIATALRAPYALSWFAASA